MPPVRRKRKVTAAATEEAAQQNRIDSAPKKQIGGNTIPDRDWIAEVSANGELHPANEEMRPKSFLYDVIWQWDGEAEELDEEFFLFYRKGKPRNCTGTAYVRDERGGYIVDREWARLTRPCLRHPARGAAVCQAHGADIPAVKLAAQRRLAEAAETVALRLIGMTDVRDEINELIDHKNRIAAANSVLDRAGIKGGVEVEVTTPGFKRVLEAMFSEGEEAGDGKEN